MTAEEFSSRVEALKPVIYRVCRAQLSRAHDREDAVQEAILRAWEKRERMRETKFFETWFIRILINACHDIQRRNRRMVAMDAPPEREPEPDHRDLYLALMALNEKQRMCVLLHYIEGYSVREVAGMLGIGESAVKVRLMRGRNKLKELLSEEVFR
jgi:RNA polymerase sigma-70 factor (ECF subfamily)